MGIILAVVVLPLLLISIVFNTLGVVSLFRFPDIYTRLHGATKCTTFGTLFSVFALLIYSLGRYFVTGEARFVVLLVHTVIAAAVLMISNPTGAHALARASHRKGFLPEPAVVDDLEESERKKGGFAA